MKDEQFYVYIVTNKNHTVLYTGVTSDLAERIFQHKSKLVRSFTSRYNIDKLVYYEVAEDKDSALSREKQIKSGHRQSKLDLINSLNPEWDDLFDTLGD